MASSSNPISNLSFFSGFQNTLEQVQATVGRAVAPMLPYSVINSIQSITPPPLAPTTALKFIKWQGELQEKGDEPNTHYLTRAQNMFDYPLPCDLTQEEKMVYQDAKHYTICKHLIQKEHRSDSELAQGKITKLFLSMLKQNLQHVKKKDYHVTHLHLPEHFERLNPLVHNALKTLMKEKNITCLQATLWYRNDANGTKRDEIIDLGHKEMIDIPLV